MKKSLVDKILKGCIIGSLASIAGLNLYTGLVDKQEFTKIFQFEAAIGVYFAVAFPLFYGATYLEDKLILKDYSKNSKNIEKEESQLPYSG